jgi:hypothetical protein
MIALRSYIKDENGGVLSIGTPTAAVQSKIKDENGGALSIGTPTAAVQSKIKDENGGAIFNVKTSQYFLCPQKSWFRIFLSYRFYPRKSRRERRDPGISARYRDIS